jgi:hypothetical protein
VIRDGLEKWRNFGRWSISVGGRIRYINLKIIFRNRLKNASSYVLVIQPTATLTTLVIVSSLYQVISSEVLGFELNSLYLSKECLVIRLNDLSTLYVS